MAQFIKIYPSIRGTIIWQDPELFSFWFYCLCEAMTQAKEDPYSGIHLQEGQMAVAKRVTDLDYNAYRFRNQVSWRAILGMLKRLENYGYISTKVVNHGGTDWHIVTLHNWPLLIGEDNTPEGR